MTMEANLRNPTRKARARVAAAAICALVLASCDRGGRDPDPPPSPAAADTATPRAPVSIIRPDIDVEREAPPLAPLEAQIGFPEGGAQIDQAAKAKLATVLNSPQAKAGGRIVLRGHSDSVGADAANLRASRARAEAVRGWLVERGIDRDRIEVIALGEQNPIEPNALPDGSPNEAGRAANRRVDLTIAVPEETPAVRSTGDDETLVDALAR